MELILILYLSINMVLVLILLLLTVYNLVKPRSLPIRYKSFDEDLLAILYQDSFKSNDESIL